MTFATYIRMRKVGDFEVVRLARFARVVTRVRNMIGAANNLLCFIRVTVSLWSAASISNQSDGISALSIPKVCGNIIPSDVAAVELKHESLVAPLYQGDI